MPTNAFALLCCYCYDERAVEGRVHKQQQQSLVAQAGADAGVVAKLSRPQATDRDRDSAGDCEPLKEQQELSFARNPQDNKKKRSRLSSGQDLPQAVPMDRPTHRDWRVKR